MVAATGTEQDMTNAFKVAWSTREIDDLKQRIAACPLPPAPEGAGWDLGCDPHFLARFRDHWLDGFDFGKAAETLNRHPQYLARVDGIDIHYVHVAGKGDDRTPLLLTHGWPGSHYEFWDVIAPLADAGFDLVIPSLPGYGFSGAPAAPIGPRAVAGLWRKLMVDVLGYSAFLAQGGDWGAVVTSQLGLQHGDVTRAIHLNMTGLRSTAPPQNPDEQAWMAQSAQAQQRLSGYSAVQMMKPLSLAWATAGNPLGQAAWILERFHDWADLSASDIEQVFGLDHLVTNAMLYVATGRFPTSLWLYHGMIREGGINVEPGQRCETPTGFAAYPGDTLMPAPPRSRVELCYNLTHWYEPGEGGHFAAMEKPGLFAADIIAWAGKA